MRDLDRIEQRLAAVERVVVDGDVELPELSTFESIAEDVTRLERRLENHEKRIAQLAATTQSLGGYVGDVEAVNESVEREAATAVATVDRLERRLDALEETIEASADAGRTGASGTTDGTEVAGTLPDRNDSAADTGASTSADRSTQNDATAGPAAGRFQFGDGSEPEAHPEDVVTAILDAPTEPAPDGADADGVDAAGQDVPTAGDADGGSATGSDRSFDGGSATAATDGGAEATAHTASQEAIARELFDEPRDEREPDDGTSGEADDGSARYFLSAFRSKLP